MHTCSRVNGLHRITRFPPSSIPYGLVLFVVIYMHALTHCLCSFCLPAKKNRNHSWNKISFWCVVKLPWCSKKSKKSRGESLLEDFLFAKIRLKRKWANIYKFPILQPVGFQLILDPFIKIEPFLTRKIQKNVCKVRKINQNRTLWTLSFFLFVYYLFFFICFFIRSKNVQKNQFCLKFIHYIDHK